jgi:hypothetical protein
MGEIIDKLLNFEETQDYDYPEIINESGITILIYTIISCDKFTIERIDKIINK